MMTMAGRSNDWCLAEEWSWLRPLVDTSPAGDIALVRGIISDEVEIAVKPAISRVDDTHASHEQVLLHSLSYSS